VASGESRGRGLDPVRDLREGEEPKCLKHFSRGDGRNGD
jgi:hypothetical protein